MNSISGTAHRLVTARVLLPGIFVFIIISNFLYWLPKDIRGNGIDIWVYTDWLIDYSSGFVRRGLSGEYIGLFSPYFHPRMVVGITIWLAYFIFVSGYIRLILKSLRNLEIAPLAGLLFLPSLPLFYIYDHDAFGRTEFLGFIILLWHLFILENLQESDTSRYIKKFLPIAMAALPIHILIHESSFLLFVPVHILISYSILKQNQAVEPVKRVLPLLMFYLPVFIAFIFVTLFGRPTLEVAADICNHWEQLGALKQGSCIIAGKNPSWALPGSFAALSWSFNQAVFLPMSLSTKAIAAWLLLFLVLGFYTVHTGNILIRKSLQASGENNFKSGPSPRVVSRYINIKYFLAPLLISSPLYILGWDFGRWFAVTSTNYALIIMSRDVIYTERIFISPNNGKEVTVNLEEYLLEKHTRYILGSILLLAVLLFIRLPHCCIGMNVFSESIRSLFR